MPTGPRVTDEEAIRALIARYCHRRDDWDLVGLAELFTEDGVLVGPARTAVGRREIAATIASGDNRRAGEGRVGSLMKHLVFNTDLTVEGDQAHAISDVVGLLYEGGTFRVVEAARYEDHFRRVAGRWYFTHKRPFGYFTRMGGNEVDEG